MSDEKQNTPTIVGIVHEIIEYVKGQPFNNVLVMLVLFVNGYCGYYLINYGVPAHLKMIQEGYERINMQHSDELKRLEQSFDRAIEIMDKRHADLLKDKRVSVASIYNGVCYDEQ